MQKSCNYWLLKTEPGEFSIDDLQSLGDQVEPWNGIRNYQARNFIRSMKPGDIALIYHSSCAKPAVVGLAEVASAPYPDPLATDTKSPFFDKKSTEENVRWSVVDVRFKAKFTKAVSLTEIKSLPELTDMSLVKRGRLSVSPVKQNEFDVILTRSGYQQ